MSITDIRNDEFFDVLKRTNLVRVRVEGCENWCVAPVLYAGDGVISLLVDYGRNVSEMGNDVTMKFQKNDYEYIVCGRVIESGASSPVSLIITPLSVHRYCNIRKHIRYDTHLHARVFDGSGVETDCIVKNISRGGIMLLSKTKVLQKDVKAKIFFESGNSISANTRLARETETDGTYIYGIGFVEMDEKDRIILNAEIGKLEGEYLKSLNFLKEYINQGTVIDTEVAVLCTSDGSMDIRESLTKMGAENFDIFYNYKVYSDFYENEHPKLVIIDAEEINDDVLNAVDNIKSAYAAINQVLIVPMEAESQITLYEELLSDIEIIYKPLVCNEFDETILKYL